MTTKGEQQLIEKTKQHGKRSLTAIKQDEFKIKTPNKKALNNIEKNKQKEKKTDSTGLKKFKNPNTWGS